MTKSINMHTLEEVDEAEATASGAAEPPKDNPPVAAAVVPPGGSTLCPESGTVCTQSCVLPGGTGSTYCTRWVARVRREAIEDRSSSK